MKKLDRLDVFYDNRLVGTLAAMKNGLVAFQYSDEWQKNGFSISPFSLPLRNDVFIPRKSNAYKFEGLFGVFNDSLPDGWGRLLVDRCLMSLNINPQSITALDRLSFVHDNGIGALSYRPSRYLEEDIPGSGKQDYDKLAEAVHSVLDNKETEDFDTLYRLGGSSGGARPKAHITLDGEAWIVKFPSKYDSPDIGRQEYDYTLCAERCGIKIPHVKLFPSKLCSGFFATKRFDRNRQQKLHVISASGVLEISHREPALDYKNLFAAAENLTGGFEYDKELYRRMCFNVFAHNRDDHAKNFTFLYDEQKAKWSLAPAYDMTYSFSIGGQHATTINGEGQNPDISNVTALGRLVGLKQKWLQTTAEEIKNTVETELGNYLF